MYSCYSLARHKICYQQTRKKTGSSLATLLWIGHLFGTESRAANSKWFRFEWKERKKKVPSKWAAFIWHKGDLSCQCWLCWSAHSSGLFLRGSFYGISVYYPRNLFWGLWWGETLPIPASHRCCPWQALQEDILSFPAVWKRVTENESVEIR